MLFKNGNRKISIALNLAIAFVLIGIIFKLEDWPYKDVVIVSAFSFLILLYLFRFKEKKEKKFIDYINPDRADLQSVLNKLQY